MKPEDWISVKDRLPEKKDKILVHTKDGQFYPVVVINPITDDGAVDAWMPIVPPPKPDPFETWWNQATLSAREFQSIRVWCKEAWDAALKSKEQSE